MDDLTREQSAVAGGDPMSLETSGRRKDGTLVDVAITLSPLRDEEGTVVGVVSVDRDVGEHILTNARLATVTHPEDLVASRERSGRRAPAPANLTRDSRRA